MPRKLARLRRFLVRAEKKLSTALSQEAEVGVKMEARVPSQPAFHLRVFMGSIVIGTQMNRARAGCRSVQLIQKSDKLLIPVAV